MPLPRGDKQQWRLGKGGIFISLSYAEALKRLLQNKSPLRPFWSRVWCIAPGTKPSLFFPRRLAGTPRSHVLGLSVVFLSARKRAFKHRPFSGGAGGGGGTRGEAEHPCIRKRMEGASPGREHRSGREEPQGCRDPGFSSSASSLRWRRLHWLGGDEV